MWVNQLVLYRWEWTTSCLQLFQQWWMECNKEHYHQNCFVLCCIPQPCTVIHASSNAPAMGMRMGWEGKVGGVGYRGKICLKMAYFGSLVESYLYDVHCHLCSGILRVLQALNMIQNLEGYCPTSFTFGGGKCSLACNIPAFRSPVMDEERIRTG